MSEDNWEDIFKKKLETQQDPFDDNGWNVPSDKVWEEIVTQLPPKDNKKKRFLFFLLPSAILLVGVGIWLVFDNSDTTSLQSLDSGVAISLGKPSETHSQKSGISSTSSKSMPAPVYSKVGEAISSVTPAVLLSAVKGTKDIPTIRKVSKNSLSERQVTTELNVHSNANVASNTSQQKSADSSALSLKSDSPQLSHNLAQDMGSPETSPDKLVDAPLREQLESASTVIKREADVWKEVQSLSPRPLAMLFWSAFALAPSTAYLKTPSRNSRYFLHIGGGPIMLQPKQSGEKQHFSFNTNVGLEYAWSKKWSFELGAQYVNLIQKLQYNIDLPYDGSNEALQSDGSFDSKYSGQVNTSLGDVNMSMVLSRLASSSLALGEKINLDVSGTERIQLLQLPFGIKYIFDLGSWAPYVKASYIPTFVLQSSVDFKTVHSNHPAVHHRGTNARISNHADFVSGFGATVGLQYKCTSRLFFTGDVQYQYLIAPLSKSQTVSPSLFGVNFGFRYGF